MVDVDVVCQLARHGSPGQEIFASVSLPLQVGGSPRRYTVRQCYSTGPPGKPGDSFQAGGVHPGGGS